MDDGCLSFIFPLFCFYNDLSLIVYCLGERSCLILVSSAPCTSFPLSVYFVHAFFIICIHGVKSERSFKLGLRGIVFCFLFFSWLPRSHFPFLLIFVYVLPAFSLHIWGTTCSSREPLSSQLSLLSPPLFFSGRNTEYCAFFTRKKKSNQILHVPRKDRPCRSMSIAFSSDNMADRDQAKWHRIMVNGSSGSVRAFRARFQIEGPVSVGDERGSRCFCSCLFLLTLTS